MKYNNLKDAFFDSKFHVGKGMLTYDNALAGSSIESLATIEDVANDESSMSALVDSKVSMTAIAGSDVALNAMFSSHIATAKITSSDIAKNAFIEAGAPVDLSGAPGSPILSGGSMDAGYFGAVPSSELFSGTELASLVGITQGTSQFNTEDWLKFAIDGEIIFKSKKPFRHSVSWDHINSRGCVDGTKTITKNGVTYKVRLMKGGDGNASDATKGPKGSEWNKLMLPIHAKARDQSWAYSNNVDVPTPYWGIDFTDQDLHTHNSHGSGSYHWCQEVFHSSATGRVSRGGPGVSHSLNYPSSSTSAGVGWSPVLEVVS